MPPGNRRLASGPFGHVNDCERLQARHSALLAGMALLSIAASPVTLALGWPEASSALFLTVQR